MAGGTFIAQNKVRPGAYINFKAVSAPAIIVPDMVYNSNYAAYRTSDL